MKPRTQAITKEFERRLREARREVWRTVVGTNEELTTLEQQARASSEEAGTMAVTGVLARLDTAERRLLDEIDAARARLAAGTFGVCERCGKSIPLARLRALPAARLCVVCERAAEHAAAG
jgi:RNA polymerase-binding transcription factor